MKKYLAKKYNRFIAAKRELQRLFRRSLNVILMRRSYTLLASMKSDQKKKFDSLKSKFEEQYQKISRHNEDKFVAPLWQDWNKIIEKEFTPYPPFYFLRNRLIRNTMFGSQKKWFKKEMDFLKNNISEEKLKPLLQEDYVGGPLLANSEYLTSAATVHHLYHLAKYIDRIRINLNSLNTVVEWGGGYGNFAKILKKYSTGNLTYIIIDTALFACLQWLYLTTILGGNEVNLLTDDEDVIKPGLINIVPLSLLKNQDITADMFVSTWALNESLPEAQNYVINHNFFNAAHILVAHTKRDKTFPFIPSLERALTDRDCQIEEIEFLPDSYYVFR